jgi:hypothetical protein
MGRVSSTMSSRWCVATVRRRRLPTTTINVCHTQIDERICVPGAYETSRRDNENLFDGGNVESPETSQATGYKQEIKRTNSTSKKLEYTSRRTRLGEEESYSSSAEYLDES